MIPDVDKPKIFVRYPPGASGNFICLLILSLSDPTVQLTEPYRAHKDRIKFDKTHNFMDQHTSLDAIRETREHTGPEADLAASVIWATNKFSFKPTSDPYYVIPTHVINPQPFMKAFAHSRLVNVTVQECELPKVAALWAKKNVRDDNLTYWFNELHLPVTSTNSDIAQAFNARYRASYHQFVQCTPSPSKGHSMNISFESIHNGLVADRLIELTEFVGANTTDQCLINARQLIAEYVRANSQLTI